MKLLRTGVLLTLACVPLSGLADERALQAALAKAQYMLKQASTEKLAAEQKASQLQAELDQLKKSSDQKIQQLQANEQQGNAQLAGKVDTMKIRYVALQEKYAQLKQEYVKVARTGQQQDSALKTQQDNFQLCLKNNRALYDINQEILGNYQDKGFWEVMQDKEPFTGFKSVKVENLIQDYQYKNEDLLLEEDLLGSAAE